MSRFPSSATTPDIGHLVVAVAELHGAIPGRDRQPMIELAES
ncbi:hypothetical protein [Maioricimonas sp. JC845]